MDGLARLSLQLSLSEIATRGGSLWHVLVGVRRSLSSRLTPTYGLNWNFGVMRNGSAFVGWISLRIHQYCGE